MIEDLTAMVCVCVCVCVRVCVLPARRRRGHRAHCSSAAVQPERRSGYCQAHSRCGLCTNTDRRRQRNCARVCAVRLSGSEVRGCRLVVSVSPVRGSLVLAVRLCLARRIYENAAATLPVTDAVDCALAIPEGLAVGGAGHHGKASVWSRLGVVSSG